MKETLREFIKRTSDIYDLTDVEEWINYNRKELLKVLQENEADK